MQRLGIPAARPAARRAARLISNRILDERAPSLGIVLDRLIEATWKMRAEPSAGCWTAPQTIKWFTTPWA